MVVWHETNAASTETLISASGAREADGRPVRPATGTHMRLRRTASLCDAALFLLHTAGVVTWVAGWWIRYGLLGYRGGPAADVPFYTNWNWWLTGGYFALTLVGMVFWSWLDSTLSVFVLPLVVGSNLFTLFAHMPVIACNPKLMQDEDTPFVVSFLGDKIVHVFVALWVLAFVAARRHHLRWLWYGHGGLHFIAWLTGGRAFDSIQHRPRGAAPVAPAPAAPATGKRARRRRRVVVESGLIPSAWDGTGAIVHAHVTGGVIATTAPAAAKGDGSRARAATQRVAMPPPDAREIHQLATNVAIVAIVLLQNIIIPLAVPLVYLTTQDYMLAYGCTLLPSNPALAFLMVAPFFVIPSLSLTIFLLAYTPWDSRFVISSRHSDSRVRAAGNARPGTETAAGTEVGGMITVTPGGTTGVTATSVVEVETSGGRAITLAA